MHKNAINGFSKDNNYINYFFDKDGNSLGGKGYDKSTTVKDVQKAASVLYWPVENFAEQARMESQLDDEGADYEQSLISSGYGIIYSFL